MSFSSSNRMRNGTQWDYSHQRNNSPFTKMQHQYWVTKETVFRKLGRKEDENIVASDAELDAKLELFRSIQDSCSDLQRIIDRYQERLVLLAQEENAMGRFLKEAGKNDKTGAGTMMLSVGKTLSHTGQLRISLRMPLVRLFQEVETFRGRAVEDTWRTVQAMERSRTEYRASLSWMKDVSQQLDPDTYNMMDKFRKVQSQVKKSKSTFDKLKLDSLQKVDLLAAARCNMFSHALITYHNALLAFASASASAFSHLTSTAKDSCKFEFSVIKELSEGHAGEADPISNNQDATAEAADNTASSPALDKLVDLESELDGLVDGSVDPPSEACPVASSSDGFLPSQLLLMHHHTPTPAQETKPMCQPSENSSNKATPSWLELFSELDPLSDPDAIGRPAGEPIRDC